MKVKPLGDRLLIRRLEAAEKSAGGIILPDNAKGKPQQGKVLAAGPGKMLKDGQRRRMQVKEGDTVIFANLAGDELKHGGEDTLLVMREEDVLAVVEG